MTPSRLFGLIIILFSVVIGQSAYPQQQAKEIVRVRGSESMTHLISVYANEFIPGNPNCNLVISGGDFHMGMETLISGETELAMISAALSPTDLKAAEAAGLKIESAVVGWGGIVIIAHRANPVVSLTVDQVNKLLTGEIKNWKQVGGPDKPVLVVAINETVRAGTYKYLTQELIHGNFAPGAKLVSYFRSVPPTVAENEGAIGIIRVRNLERMHDQGQDKTIKEIAVKKDDASPAVMPTRETVDEGIYPITRPYFLYVATNKANKCTMDFFKYCAARNPRLHVPQTKK
jgi:phosphate transport system substrate-binding protein